MYVCDFQNHSIKPVHIMTKTLCLLAIVLSSLGMARCQNRSSDVSELTQKAAEVPIIALNSLEMQEVPGLTFFDQDDWKTMSIENGAVKMKKEFSYWGQIGEVDSIPFYRITFEMDGQSLTVDSLLGLGKPSLSKHSGKLVVPVVLKQYDSFIFDGKLVLIDFRGYRVNTIDVLTNSCAACLSGDVCYYCSSGNIDLYAFNLSSGENQHIAVLSDEEGGYPAVFSLDRDSDGTFTLQYYSDFTHDIEEHNPGKKVQFQL